MMRAQLEQGAKKGRAANMRERRANQRAIRGRDRVSDSTSELQRRADFEALEREVAEQQNKQNTRIGGFSGGGFDGSGSVEPSDLAACAGFGRDQSDFQIGRLKTKISAVDGKLVLNKQ